uniref:Uncharacterized protein n=1 Tax=Tanacetum cinerariifolium TaxID=118510 RepID=A0A699JDL9_TANCI|nr:hypothetical protein [Tanacetum cinerariifolium]
MWIQQPIDYNKHALWGVSHWGRKCKQFYEYAVNRESARDVYSKRRIIAVTELQIIEWHYYKHLDWISWIEDLAPHTMWIHELLNYDKHALWGVSHWGRKRQQFYGFVVNQESALDDSKRRFIAVTDLKIVEWHNYKHLDWISDVYKEYRHPATCGRSSTGSRKLPEEA